MSSARNITGLLARLSERVPDLAAGHVGSCNDWSSIAMLSGTDTGSLLAWLDAEATLHAGMDRKAQGAFVMGRAARAVALPLVGLWAGYGIVPRLSPDLVALTLERYRWQRDGESGDSIRYGVHLNHDMIDCAADTGDALRQALHDALVAVLAPLVAALRTSTGLAPGALWRLTTDMVCYVFLHVGEAFGVAEQARAEALMITRRPGSVLHNRQSGFQHIELADLTEPSRIIAAQWFITRGGCCRWYTCIEGERCSVCVLRPAAEQQAMLRDHLRAQQKTAEPTAGKP